MVLSSSACQSPAQARRKASHGLGLGWLKPTLALITVVGSVVGLAWLLEWLNDPYQWPVRSVHIEGRFRNLQPAQIQNQVAPLTAAGFFAVNVAAIQGQLQRLPWVEHCKIGTIGAPAV